MRIGQFIVSQTNPWVVPFLPDNDQPVADMPLSIQGVTSRLIHVAVAQLRCVRGCSCVQSALRCF
jgi:hypothetical protein